MGIVSKLTSQLEINGLLFHRQHGFDRVMLPRMCLRGGKKFFVIMFGQFLDFYMFNYERTGQRQLFVIEFPSCQLNESPQTTVPGTGPIDQPFGIPCFVEHCERITD